MMPVHDFLIIFGVCALTMLACRVLPVMLMKGKELPPTVVIALNFIPPATFAALVANDLFKPDLIVSGDVWSWVAPLIAAAVVMGVGFKTKSLAWCIVVGVSFLAVLLYLPGLTL